MIKTSLLAKELSENSDISVVAAKTKEAFVVSLKGNVPCITYLIGLLIKTLHEEHDVPLKDLGALINRAVECQLKGDEEK